MPGARVELREVVVRRGGRAILDHVSLTVEPGELVVDPTLLLLDEPFGALDPETRARLQEDLATLHARSGVTTLLVSHDLGEALLLATRIVVVIAGRIAQVASPRELLARPATPD